MKVSSTHKKFLGALLAVGFLLSAGFITQDSYSLALTDASVTLSNSRLSFLGALSANNTTGTSVVEIKTAGSPSISTSQLVEGDELTIGANTYNVASTSSDSTFYLTAPDVLAAGDADEDDPVIGVQTATHTVRFTTANAINDGAFRILVPAHDTTPNDGVPDQGAFDYNTTPTVTCPANITGYTFAAGTSAPASLTIGDTDYHVFECSYTGTGGSGTVFDGTTNDAIVIDNLINPAPVADHDEGIADTHPIILQHLDSTDGVIDTTTVKVGFIEAVRITTSVPAQLNFKIEGVAEGTNTCGISTDVDTTPTMVPFGEIALDGFTNAAQTLTVSTNAANGYTVTALANDQLGLDGVACTGDPAANNTDNCINDSKGDGTTMSHTVEAEWNTIAAKGFGFSLHDTDNNISNGNAEAFSYNTVGGACTGTYCARQFADAESGQLPVEIFGSNTVADAEDLNVCYRIIPSVTTPAGNYENYITYTATATF